MRRSGRWFKRWVRRRASKGSPSRSGPWLRRGRDEGEPPNAPQEDREAPRACCVLHPLLPRMFLRRDQRAASRRVRRLGGSLRPDSADRETTQAPPQGKEVEVKKSYIVCDADDHLRVRYITDSKDEAVMLALDEDELWKRNVIIEAEVYVNSPLPKGRKDKRK